MLSTWSTLVHGLLIYLDGGVYLRVDRFFIIITAVWICIAGLCMVLYAFTGNGLPLEWHTEARCPFVSHALQDHPLVKTMHCLLSWSVFPHLRHVHCWHWNFWLFPCEPNAAIGSTETIYCLFIAFVDTFVESYIATSIAATVYVGLSIPTILSFKMKKWQNIL